MTRLITPLALSLAFITSSGALAAPADGEVVEPTPEQPSGRTVEAERRGGGAQGGGARGATARGAHHAAPDGPSSARTSGGHARPDQPSGAHARPDRPGDSRPDYSRAGQASRRPDTRAEANQAHANVTHHKKTVANKTHHQQVTRHKRAVAHKTAVTHRSALARYRAYRDWRVRHGYRWYHGIFVYGPSPWRTSVHVSGGGGGGGGGNSGSPTRTLDRNNQVMLGFRAGSYISDYDLGGAFSDVGLGLTGRWRPTESLGLEMAYTYYNDTFDEFSERETGVIQPSVQLFAFPWSRINPYISTGITWAKRSYDDVYFDGFQNQTAYVQETASGLHGGLGLELNFGDRAALDLEGRYIGFLNTGDDDGGPGAIQGTAGFNVYF